MRSSVVTAGPSPWDQRTVGHQWNVAPSENAGRAETDVGDEIVEVAGILEAETGTDGAAGIPEAEVAEIAAAVVVGDDVTRIEATSEGPTEP